jgi:hypothetical protein
MAKKKSIVRKPIEKLSEKEAVVLIEDSSSEEEDTEIEAPPKIVKEKKPRTAKQLANDQRLREAAEARRNAKNKVVEDVAVPKQIKKEKVKKEKPAPEPAPIAVEDPDDKPLTMKQYKALMAAQKPAEPKPKRPYKKREKKTAPPAPTPPPTPTASVPNPPPQMLFV